MKPDETYRTSNLYEAAYLLAQGYALAGKERAGKRTVILFAAVNGIRQAALDYYAGAAIEARLLADKYRALKDYIFSDMTEHKQEDTTHGIPDPHR